MECLLVFCPGELRELFRNHRSCSFDSYRALLIHIREHQRNVGGQEVIHLVTQRGFAKELWTAHEVSYRHVEVSVAGRPIGDSCEGMCDQYILKKRLWVNLIGWYKISGVAWLLGELFVLPSTEDVWGSHRACWWRSAATQGNSVPCLDRKSVV